MHMRALILVGGATCLLSVYGAAHSTSFIEFFIFYACLFPFGIGLTYWAPIVGAWEWFGRVKGTASGIIMAAFGMAAFVFGFATTAIVNPENEGRVADPETGKLYFRREVADRVPKMFKDCLIAWTLMLLVATFLVTRNPKYAKTKTAHQAKAAARVQTLREIEEQVSASGTMIEEEPQRQTQAEVTVRQALGSRPFFLLTLMLLNGVFYGAYMTSVYKAVSIEHLGDGTLTTAGAIGAVCNGASRIVWATLQDKYGFKRVYFVLLVIQLLVSALVYPLRADAPAYLLCVALSFACGGGHFSMFPRASVEVFGLQNGGQIFTAMFFAIPVSSNVGLLLARYAQPHVGAQSIFWFASLLTLLNIILLHWFDESPLRASAPRSLSEKKKGALRSTGAEEESL